MHYCAFMAPACKSYALALRAGLKLKQLRKNLFFLYSSIGSNCPMLNHTVWLISERFEPSSRTFLIGEQPNAWQLLHRRAKVSRHRGAELRRRYELLGGTSLLSLE